MYAIKTKYLPATNTKPSRYKASVWNGSITINTEYAFTSEQNHILAAYRLTQKLNLPNRFVSAQLPDQTYAHIFCQ